MMLGLESWIPIYMTGQVSPYYLKGVQNTVYCHFHYVSGAAALTGECITAFTKTAITISRITVKRCSTAAASQTTCCKKRSP